MMTDSIWSLQEIIQSVAIPWQFVQISDFSVKIPGFFSSSSEKTQYSLLAKNVVVITLEQR